MTTADTPLDLSVVIGFKDWGRDRLLVAVRSVLAAMDGVTGEVVVSDYGSSDSEGVQHAVESLGGRYVHTPTDGVWSRSRALNAGFARAEGKVFVATDADMAFSSGSLAHVARLVRDDPGTAAALQYRDLPEAFAAQTFLDPEIDWEALDAASRLRPRWGMGVIAVSREVFAHVRGFDERMDVYGGEDLDFAERVRRAGCRIHWVDDPAVRVYHVWHESSRAAADSTAEGRAAIAANRAIVREDASFVRNTRRWLHPVAGSGPTVTVVVATDDDHPLLPDAMSSVLAQTMTDFELVVADAGSLETTREVVSASDDPRVRYLRLAQNSGVVAARQHVAEVTRSRYSVIHEGSDLMLPWRLEAHLAALVPGVNGTYGGRVRFDDAEGSLSSEPGTDLSLAAVLFSPEVYLHGTLMLETTLLSRLRYDRTLQSGAAELDLVLRLMRSGVTLAHTGDFHVLRSRQLPADLEEPLVLPSSFMARNPVGPAQTGALRSAVALSAPVRVRGAENLEEHVRPYLPDHLVERLAVVRTDGGVAPVMDVLGPQVELIARSSSTRADGSRIEDLVVRGVTWPDVARLRTGAFDARLHDARSVAAQGIAGAGALSEITASLRNEADRHSDEEVIVVTRRRTDTRAGVDVVKQAAERLRGRWAAAREIEGHDESRVAEAIAIPMDADVLGCIDHLASLAGVMSVCAAPGWTDEEFGARLAEHVGGAS